MVQSHLYRRDNIWQDKVRILKVENGKWSLKRIEDEFVGTHTEDEKYRVLYFTDSTFTNAHEAIEYLRDL